MAKTTTTKKTTPKKTKPKTKRKNSKKKSKKSFKFYINIIILFLIVSFIIFLLNTLFFTNEIKESSKVQKKQAIEKLKKTLKNNKENYEELTDELKIQYVEMPKINQTKISKKDDTQDEEFVFNDYKKELESVKVAKVKENNKIIKPIKNIIKKESPQIIKKYSKPILAILIDDVTRQRQVNKILALPYDITMSFLPPTPTHKKSALIAQNIKVAMIHLPTEASNRKYEEKDTLHIGDSFAKIDKKIASLKKLYPNIKYINNHTGSKFTKNHQAMDRLVKSLKKHGYYFVDSRTTSKTVIKKYSKKYNLKYLSRNVFLDNTQEKEYIQHQLMQAVKIAKKKGSAIAIGHPYNITIKTIGESKDILKDVQIVYINELKI